MAQIAIVGNGPSRSLYRPFKGDVCVCNIPQLDIEYDYIAMVDNKAMDYINKKNLAFDRPILTTKEVAKNCKTETPIEPVFAEKLMNTASTASFYFADTYDTIWLFGCDALWSDVVTSHQDTLIKRPTRAPNLHTRWRGYWKKVWQTGKKFVIVCPKDTEVIHYGENVIWNHARR